MSSSSSSSSEGSSSPPPEILTQSKKTKKSKNHEGKSSVHEPYTPPPNATALNHSNVEFGEFDWDTINDDKDTELWLIRVPDSIKTKHLQDLTLDPMPSSKVKRTSRVGVLPRKQINFDIWCLGEDNGDTGAGGEEIKGFSCLLPRKSKKGKLYKSSKPIAKHLVVSAQAVVPELRESSVTTHQNPPRFAYPDELLTHKFMPYGSQAPLGKEAAAESGHSLVTDKMDVDVEQRQKTEAKTKKDKKSAKTSKDEENVVSKKEKGKSKRQGDALSPKKSKKVKTDSDAV